MPLEKNFLLNPENKKNIRKRENFQTLKNQDFPALFVKTSKPLNFFIIRWGVVTGWGEAPLFFWEENLVALCGANMQLIYVIWITLPKTTL